ncbi:MAG: TIGR02594 family protein, partial [Pseudomonadota bacterium]
MTTPAWFQEARRDLGVTEWEGPEDNNPRITTWFEEVGATWFEHDEVPGCAAAMGAWFKRAGLAIPSASVVSRARAWLDWGVALKSPRQGAVMVLGRDNDPSKGHVTLYDRDAGDGVHFHGLGANQSDSVNVALFRYDAILPGGMRWPEQPANVPAPEPAKAVGTALVSSGTILGAALTAILSALTWVQETVLAAVDQFSSLKPITDAAISMGVDSVATFWATLTFG